MGNICCTETSSDDYNKSNGRVRTHDESNQLQGADADSFELQHISEREHGMQFWFLPI